MFQNDFLSDIGIRKLLQSRQSLFEGTAYIEIAHNGLSGTVLCQMSYCLKKEIKKNQSVGEISEVFRFSWFRVLIMISYRNCERRYYNGTCDLWGKSYKSGNEEEFGVDVFLQLSVTQKPFCYALIGRRAPCRGYQMSQEGQLDIGHF